MIRDYSPIVEGAPRAVRHVLSGPYSAFRFESALDNFRILGNPEVGISPNPPKLRCEQW
jgi:hypothetical protein